MQEALNNRSHFGLSGGSSLNIFVRPPKLPGIDGSNVKLGPGPARQRATSAPCPVPHRLPNLGPLAAARPCCVTAAQPRLHSVHGMRAEHPKQYFLTGKEHMDLLFFSNEVIAIPPPRYCEHLLPTKLGTPPSNKRRAPPRKSLTSVIPMLYHSPKEVLHPKTNRIAMKYRLLNALAGVLCGYPRLRSVCARR